MNHEECNGNCDDCRHRVPVITITGEFKVTGLGGEIIYRCDMEWETGTDD